MDDDYDEIYSSTMYYYCSNYMLDPGQHPVMFFRDEHFASRRDGVGEKGVICPLSARRCSRNCINLVKKKGNKYLVRDYKGK